MKKYLFIFALSASQNLSSQTFYSIGTDVSGDCTCSCMDISSFDYAFDIGLDSVWFKITTYNNRNANYGYHIVVNRDGNLLNGDSWSGASSGPCMGFMDFNMNHDRMIAVWPALSFVEQYDGTGGTILHYSVLKQLISPTVTIIGVKLSEVDANTDGIFDVILGLGDEYYVNNDAAPNTGYYTTSPLTVQSIEKNMFSIHPNPCTDFLSINANKEILESEKIFISDISGKQVSAVISNNSKSILVNTLNLEIGMYYLNFLNYVIPFVKIE